MKKILSFLVAIVTVFVVSGCYDYCKPDLDPKEPVDSPTPQPPGTIELSNDKNLDGTYVITGPGDYGCKMATSYLFFTPPSAEGKYKVKFINLKSTDNTYKIDGKKPIFTGVADLPLPYDGKKISVNLTEISAKISFPKQEGVKIQRILIADVYDSIFINGDFVKQNSTVNMELGNEGGYIIATKIQMYINYDLVNEHGRPEKSATANVLLDAQPGHKYNITVNKNGASVSE